MGYLMDFLHNLPWPHTLDFADHLVPPEFSLLAAVPTALSLVFVPNFIKVCLLIAITGSYDNIHPRQQVQAATIELKASSPAKGYLIRAVACHYNAWEGFIMFTAAAMLAHITHVDPQVASSLATLFLAARVAFTFLYVFGRTSPVAMARTAAWLIGCFCCYRLMHLAVLKHQYHQQQPLLHEGSSLPSMLMD